MFLCLVWEESDTLPFQMYTQAVPHLKWKPHLQFLCGDFLNNKLLSEWSNCSPACQLCVHSDNLDTSSSAPVEDTCHILTICPTLSDTRNRILLDIQTLCQTSICYIDFDVILSDKHVLTQFILDPTSLNLKTNVNISDPMVPELYRLSRDICYALHRERKERLNIISKTASNI